MNIIKHAKSKSIIHTHHIQTEALFTEEQCNVVGKQLGERGYLPIVVGTAKPDFLMLVLADNRMFTDGIIAKDIEYALAQAKPES
ncbi:MAG: hypothetical protein KQI81_08680 [Deltaproteobacteria bacterium]|nr:hypothetical protein [Deltaproteobacteria bacterium]